MNINTIKRIQVLGFLVLISGLAYLQLYKGTSLFERASKNYIRLVPQDAPRGIIYDRNSKPLVRNKLEYDISVFLKRRSDKREILEKVSDAIDVPLFELEEKFKKNYLAPFIPTSIYKTDDRIKILKLEEAGIDGCIIVTKGRRSLLDPEAFAHVVGYVNKPSKKHRFLRKYGYSLQENIGYSGVEEIYNAYLRGVYGGRQVEVNAQGKVVNVVAEELPRKGKDIYLTIDRDLQSLAYKSLKGYRGSIILMDVNDGSILVMASSPSFDVNLFRKSSSYINSVFKDKQLPLLNRPIQGLYPMGSVFKPVVALAGLTSKRVDDETKFFCTGVYNIGKARFKCHSVHDWENLGDAITHSCNVFFYNIGMRVGADMLADFGHYVGLGRKTNVDLPNEKAGVLPTAFWKKRKLKSGWYSGDTVNMSIGQGYMTATPLQVARLMGFFATNGKIVEPHVLNKIEAMELQKYEVIDIEPDLNSMYLIKDGLRRVVADKKGTARELKRLGMQIAGKTGTAQVSRKAAHGWFAGFFPYREPKYSVVVMLENAGSSHVAVDVLEKFLKQVKDKNLLPEFIDDSVG